MTGPGVRMEGNLEEDAEQQYGPMEPIQNFTVAQINGGHGGQSAASIRMVNATQKKNLMWLLVVLKISGTENSRNYKRFSIFF